MKVFYLTSTLLLGFVMCQQIFSYLKVKYQVSSKQKTIIKIKAFKTWDYYFISLGLITITASLIGVKINGIIIQFTFWLFLGLCYFLLGILKKGEYVLVGSTGIETNRILKWDLITDIKVDDNNILVISVKNSKKCMHIPSYTNERINEILEKIRYYSPLTYENHLRTSK
jgi:hypothetical protein